MKRSKEKKNTKKKLLKTAEKLFIEKGFNISTVEITKKAGLAHGTIFFHFKNRDEIVLNVVINLIKKITDSLYFEVRETKSLESFLHSYTKILKKNWPLYRSLLSGFSDFNEETKEVVITYFAAINGQIMEAFNKWSDNSFTRTILWQGAMVYLTFFGDYMFNENKVKEKHIENIISFLTTRG
ncbi:TetR/AcrR family transcriptional regulator [Candidatus Poribacteria bacterium]|nr:TetR/AcrR family transcriptional regulator [Candidatus Poribacteria bacterium]